MHVIFAFPISANKPGYVGGVVWNNPILKQTTQLLKKTENDMDELANIWFP